MVRDRVNGEPPEAGPGGEARGHNGPFGRLSPTGETRRKRTLGFVVDKIAKKILSSRGSKVVDLASWRGVRARAALRDLAGG